MSFAIRIAGSEQHYRCGSDETLLDAALAAGFWMPHRCRNGACGACKCQLLSGEVDHGPALYSSLSAGERQDGKLLPCCARPREDLLIECAAAEAPGEIRVKRLLMQVRQLTHQDAATLRLRLRWSAQQRFTCHAGQSLDVLLDEGQRRPARICDRHEEDRCIELELQRLVGADGGDALFDQLSVGTSLRIEGPFGHADGDAQLRSAVRAA